MSVPMWKMRNGDEIAIVKMEDSHLLNAVSMVQRKAVFAAYRLRGLSPLAKHPQLLCAHAHSNLVAEVKHRRLEVPPWLSYEDALKAQALIDIEYLKLKPSGSSGLNSESAG